MSSLNLYKCVTFGCLNGSNRRDMNCGPMEPYTARMVSAFPAGSSLVTSNSPTNLQCMQLNVCKGKAYRSLQHFEDPIMLQSNFKQEAKSKQKAQLSPPLVCRTLQKL